MLGSIHITILWNTAPFVLKNNEADSSAMLVPIDQTTLHHIPEDRNLKTVSCSGCVYKKKNQRQRKHMKKARGR
jgi:hypothetical protein